MFNWLKRKSPKPVELGDQLAQGKRYSPAGGLDRLNSAHWEKATLQTINQVIEDEKNLLERCLFEYVCNPTVKGVVRTHTNDVVGPNGPELKAYTLDATYAKNFEEAWAQWWEYCDVGKARTGIGLLTEQISMLWRCGEFILQLVNSPEQEFVIGKKGDKIALPSLRLNAIHPKDLRADTARLGDPWTRLGVTRNPNGSPKEYAVWGTNAFQLPLMTPIAPTYIPASQIIHFYFKEEPGQVRGYPWIAHGLQGAADLRDYDAQVLDAARAAADSGMMLKSSNPELTPVSVTGTASYQRRQLNVLPPGWDMVQMTPGQPAATYIEYRNERLRDIGRPIGMPLMMIRLDSREHNYSSARFDSQVYQRGIQALQGDLAREALNRVVDEWMREAELIGLLPAMPEDFRYDWTWSPFPHVDPEKEMKAAVGRLDGGISSKTLECARMGTNYADIAQQIKADDELDKALGIEKKAPVIPGEQEPPVADEETTDENAKPKAAE